MWLTDGSPTEPDCTTPKPKKSAVSRPSTELTILPKRRRVRKKAPPVVVQPGARPAAAGREGEAGCSLPVGSSSAGQVNETTSVLSADFNRVEAERRGAVPVSALSKLSHSRYSRRGTRLLE